MNTAAKSSDIDNSMGASGNFPSGILTSESLTPELLNSTREWLTSLPQGSHASRLVARVKAKRKKMIETCSPRQLNLFGSSDPALSFLRMFPVFSVSGMPCTYSGRCVTSATKHYPLSSLGLMTLVPHTGGNGPGCSLTTPKFPTPYGLSGNQGQGDGEFGKAIRNYPTPTEGDAKRGQNESDGRRGQTLLGAARKQPWPTPSARDWKSGKASPETMAKNSRPLNEVIESGGGTGTRQTWATPTGRLGTPRGPQAKRFTDPKRSNDLDDQVAHVAKEIQKEREHIKTREPVSEGDDAWTKEDEKRYQEQLVKWRMEPEPMGNLNPAWVEWLMNWPIDWTSLEPLSEDRFQEWLRLSGIG